MQRNTGYFPTESLEPSGNRLFSRSALNEGDLFRGSLNQEFYKTDEWRAIRDVVIIRDNGCDLGVDDRQIGGRILVHHMNPITKEDILYRSKMLLDPEYLICTTDNTHKAIHYGDENLLIKNPIERRPNDTCPWRH